MFNRYNHLNEMLQHWNNDQPSNIGLGQFERNEDFTITKTFGRTDLGLINHSDGDQYCFELYGFRANTPSEVKEEMYKEIVNDFENVLRSIHYQNWLSNQEIKNMPIEEVLLLLQEGLNSFNYTEALSLFSKIEF